MSEDESTPCYIARCKCGCGHLVFAIVDEPRSAKEVAKAILNGFAIERMTTGEVRKSDFGCATRKQKKVEATA